MAATHDTVETLAEPISFHTALDEAHFKPPYTKTGPVLVVRRDASATELADLVHARIDWIRQAVRFASSAQSDERPEDLAELLRPMIDEAHILSAMLVAATRDATHAA
jgi:hypothetical protein